MGGRGSASRLRADAGPTRFEPLPLPDETEQATPTEHAPEQDPAAEQPTMPEQPDTPDPVADPVDPGVSWERVQAAGLTNASREDLIAAQDAAPTIGKQWDLQDELKRRAEDQARQGVHAAREADRALTVDCATQVQNAITTVGDQLRRGDWIRMADLRAALPADMSRAEVDAVLRRLSRSGDITLAADPDRKSHTLADHENGIWLGNENNHLITWDHTS